MNGTELLKLAPGGRRYIDVDKYTFVRVLGAIDTLTPIEETSSTHWWEDVYDVSGELYAVGGPHGEDVLVIERIVFF